MYRPWLVYKLFLLIFLWRWNCVCVSLESDRFIEQKLGIFLVAFLLVWLLCLFCVNRYIWNQWDYEWEKNQFQTFQVKSNKNLFTNIKSILCSFRSRLISYLTWYPSLSLSLSFPLFLLFSLFIPQEQNETSNKITVFIHLLCVHANNVRCVPFVSSMMNKQNQKFVVFFLATVKY